MEQYQEQIDEIKNRCLERGEEIEDISMKVDALIGESVTQGEETGKLVKNVSRLDGMMKVAIPLLMVIITLLFFVVRNGYHP